MDLDDWRSRINDLDDQILSLLNQRGHAALQIGELKRQQDSPYFVPEREAQLLERLLSLNRGPLGPLAEHPLKDRRVRVDVGDVAATLRSCPGQFDAVLLDVDNGPDAFTASHNARTSNPWEPSQPGS